MKPSMKALIPVTLVGIFGALASANAQDAAPADPPLWSQADAYYTAEDMVKAREEVLSEGGAQRTYFILFNQLEAQVADGHEGLSWNGQAWYGGDLHKILFKTEGSASLNGDGVDDAEIQALYSRAIAPYWDVQAGVRYDLEPEGLAHGVVAVQGLAPYWFEVDASAFLSEKGDLTARLEAEYEFRLTQRLILQPRVEANIAAQAIAEREIGSGLTNLDAGLRLRYEIKREFAPYIGVEWQGSFGGTKDLIDAAGGDGDQTVFVAGVRTWF